MKKFLLLASLLAFCAVSAPDVFAAEPAAAAEKPWIVRCKEEDKGKKIKEIKRGICEIFQRLVVKETGQRFVEVAIGFPPDKQTARGIVIVPLGVLLQTGMTMKIDDGKAYKFQARYCDVNGCFGFVDLSNELLATMASGTKMTITFQALNKKEINVELTLKDFSAALKQVS